MVSTVWRRERRAPSSVARLQEVAGGDASGGPEQHAARWRHVAACASDHLSVRLHRARRAPIDDLRADTPRCSYQGQPSWYQDSWLRMRFGQSALRTHQSHAENAHAPPPGIRLTTTTKRCATKPQRGARTQRMSRLLMPIPKAVVATRTRVRSSMKSLWTRVRSSCPRSAVYAATCPRLTVSVTPSVHY
jgi:hypothetical protein